MRVDKEAHNALEVVGRKWFLNTAGLEFSRKTRWAHTVMQ